MSAQAAQRVKDIVDELLSTRISDLGDQMQTQKRLSELQTSLAEVETFAESIAGLIGRFEPGPARRGRPPKSGVPGRKPGRPRGAGRRGPGEFSATPFILSAVKEAGTSGIRPREIVEKVVVAAPGQHVRPSALVSTILTRLKRRGEVRRRAGRWYGK
jgi:hypothetical protein